MRAFHNDPAIKAKYLERVKQHRAADELIKGIGWEQWPRTRGCAVGCTLDAYDHSRYPIELGIPLQLAHLEDELFELQSKKDAMEWPEKFLSAISPGADLSKVWSQWAIWMLVDPQWGVVQFAETDKAVIKQVAELYARAARGDEPSEAEWQTARAAAWAAAGAASAAWAAWAAEAAASAAASAGARAAGKAGWVKAACDELIRLLEEGPQ